jgi:hypothetical protein
MILSSDTDQTEVELQLVHYQFPDNDNDEWDSNWLIVSVRVVAPVATWTASDPCLTTIEVHNLANWLADQALGRSTNSQIVFTEPNLSLEVVGRKGDAFDLRFYFSLECLPPTVEMDYDDEDTEEFFIPLIVSTSGLRHASNQLCREIQQFPIRANARRWCPECREV